MSVLLSASRRYCRSRWRTSASARWRSPTWSASRQPSTPSASATTPAADIATNALSHQPARMSCSDRDANATSG